MHTRQRAFISSLALVALGSAWACGSDDALSISLPDAGGDGMATGDGNAFDGSAFDGSAFDAGGPDAAVVDSAPPCVGLECQQVTCDGGATTQVSGTVLDPALKNPVYNAIVYVPNGPLAAIKHGPSCDRCADAPSGSPLTITTTGADGKFTLTNMPVGVDIPLVIQIGKWRRATKVTVAACSDNALPQTLTRLPKNSAEGDLPQMAIAMGACDPLECLLRKIGIDDSEFTPSNGNGHVHLYQGTGAGNSQSGGNGTQPSTDLWGSKLGAYDVVLNACECSQPDPNNKVPVSTVRDYANQGGRVYASHYQSHWIQQGAAPFPATATWNGNGNVVANNPVTVNQAYDKQKALASWLLATGASGMKGQITLADLRPDVLQASAPAIAWLEIPKNGQNPNLVTAYTFQAPFSAAVDGGADGGLDSGVDSGADAGPDGGAGPACGKVAFGDYHAGAQLMNANVSFPAQCGGGGDAGAPAMTANEKLMEFMFFDLMSCIQDDTQSPVVPPRK